MRAGLSFFFAGVLVACTSSSDVKHGADSGGPAPEAGSTEISIEHVRVGDMTFDVRTAGPKDGEPVILLHGFPETSYEWRHQLVALARAGYRAIAPDQRGYSPGARPPAVADYAVVLLTGDVISLADAMGIEKFHVVGHDWGAAVAWAVAKLSASRVLTLTAMSVPHPDAFKALLADHNSCQYTASQYFDYFVTPAATDGLLGADAGGLRLVYSGIPADDIQVYLDALGTHEALDAALNWYRANVKDRMIDAPDLGKITVPTLFIWSDGDTALCREGGDLTASYVDAPYRFEIIPGVNHWVPELAADRVSELLLSELSGRDH